MNSLVPYTPRNGLVPVAPSLFDARTALSKWLRQNRNPNTVRAFTGDLRTYADWRGLDNEQAAAFLVSLGQAQINAELMDYTDWLEGRVRTGEIKASTAGRKLVALRSMLKVFRTLDYTSTTIEIKGIKRDQDAGRKHWSTAMTRKILRSIDGDEIADIRDRAMFRLMADHGLRESSVVSLNYANVDLEAGTVSVTLKGHLDRKAKTLTPQSAKALAIWMEAWGVKDPSSPVFVSLAPVVRAGVEQYDGLTVSGLYWIVRQRGIAVGLTLARPHLIRAGAITEVYLRTKDIAMAQRFADHVSSDTTMGYVRFAEDLAAKAAALAADALDEEDGAA